MSTPIETAAEALTRYALDHGGDFAISDSEYDAALARTAFASLTQHRDDIARVLWETPLRDGYKPASRWADQEPYVQELFLRQADAVLAYLTGGTG